MPALALPYPKNRRDGARLLSSALVVTSIGLIAHNPFGWSVAGLGGLVSLYCWSCYRRLER